MTDSNPIEIIYIEEGSTCSKAADHNERNVNDTNGGSENCANAASLNATQDIILRCLQCGFEFSDKSLFKTHLLVHSETRPFKCPHCYTRFKTKEDLVKHHHKIHKRVRPYKCLKCDEVFKSIKVLKKHVLNNHNFESDASKPRNPRFTRADRKNIKPKIKILTSTSLVENEVKPSIHEPISALDSAGNNPGANRPWQDPEPLSSQLTEIQSSTIPTETDNSCPNCNFQCDDSDVFKDHLLTHSTPHIFKCPHCEEHLTGKLNLRRHFRNVHWDLEKHPCIFCPQTFELYSALRYHLMCHNSANKLYTCKICAGSFKLKNTLRKHMLVHSDEKPFGCPSCPAKFKRKENLKQHAVIHFKSNLKHKTKSC